MGPKNPYYITGYPLSYVCYEQRTYTSSSPFTSCAHILMICCFNVKWTTISSKPAAMVASAAMTERYAYILTSGIRF